MRTLMSLMLACVAWFPLSSYAQAYQEVRIVAPDNDTTIHSNNGHLSVEVTLTPALAAGDRLALLLDAKKVAQERKLHFKLNNIDRGTHTLQAQVIAADGKVLATSPLVVFHMWHASRLFKHPQQMK
jgi:C4-dicarboxylate-specific signal transduction histidine kinase